MAQLKRFVVLAALVFAAACVSRKQDSLADGVFPPSLIYAADLIPEYTDSNSNKHKWEVIEDVSPSTFDVSKLKPRSFLTDGKSWISGQEMRQRAIELKCNLGLSDAKRLFAEQNKISVEFRDFNIPLLGTVLRSPDGNLFVLYLYRNGHQWALRLYWLYDGWHVGDRLACGE